MKSLQQMTKSELINLIVNNLGDINDKDEVIECASCGSRVDGKYYYICDECEEANNNEPDITGEANDEIQTKRNK